MTNVNGNGNGNRNGNGGAKRTFMGAGKYITPPLAGLGSPGWETKDCGLYRGYSSSTPDFSQCYQQCSDTAGTCNPTDPNGGWCQPLSVINIPTTEDGEVVLFSTVAAVVAAISVLAVYETGTLTAAPMTDVLIGQWRSGRLRQQFPGWGSQSEVITSGGSQNISQQTPEDLFLDGSFFSEEVLLNGQNNMPPAMARVNIAQGNDGFRFTLRNTNAAGIDVLLKLYLRYNSSAAR